MNVELQWNEKNKDLIGFDDPNNKPIWGSIKDLKPFKLVEKSSYGESTDQLNNMFIKGDNLNSLLILRDNFKNKIKCIYIDPPFNTGKIFDHYADAVDGNIWLSMMKIRLELMKELLTEDGVIFVHIDDDEMPYLKILMDEIFCDKGQKNLKANHVATIIWQKKFAPQNDAKYFSDVHDFILVYAKNIKNLNLNLIERTEQQDERYSNRDNDFRGKWMSSDLTVKTPNPSWIYPIKLPSGRIVRPAKSRSWGFAYERFEELVKDNRIWFGESGNSMPRLKRFLTEVKAGVVPKTLWLRDEVGDNSEGKKELKKFIKDGKNVFTTPKPERLLKRILHISTNENDWVLDAFLGSGTTCAVAHKMGRRWIGLENGDQLNDICIPRLQAIIDGRDDGGITNEVSWRKGGGYQYFEME